MMNLTRFRQNNSLEALTFQVPKPYERVPPPHLAPIVSFYETQPRNYLEHVVAQSHSHAPATNISSAQTPISVAPDESSLDDVIYHNSHPVVAHSHPENLDVIVELAKESNPEIAQGLLANPERAKARLLYKRPSDADIRFMAITQFKSALYHDDSLVTQRIAVLREDQPTSIIEYGLSPSMKFALDSSAREFREAVIDYKKNPNKVTKQKMVRAGKTATKLVDRIEDSYRSQLIQYDSTHARPWEGLGKPEPSFEEFQERVNGEGIVNIKDLGSYGRPVSLYGSELRKAA